MRTPPPPRGRLRLRLRLRLRRGAPPRFPARVPVSPRRQRRRVGLVRVVGKIIRVVLRVRLDHRRARRSPPRRVLPPRRSVRTPRSALRPGRPPARSGPPRVGPWDPPRRRRRLQSGADPKRPRGSPPAPETAPRGRRLPRGSPVERVPWTTGRVGILLLGIPAPRFRRAPLPRDESGGGDFVFDLGGGAPRRGGRGEQPRRVEGQLLRLAAPPLPGLRDPRTNRADLVPVVVRVAVAQPPRRARGAAAATAAAATAPAAPPRRAGAASAAVASFSSGEGAARVPVSRPALVGGEKIAPPPRGEPRPKPRPKFPEVPRSSSGSGGGPLRLRIKSSRLTPPSFAPPLAPPFASRNDGGGEDRLVNRSESFWARVAAVWFVRSVRFGSVWSPGGDPNPAAAASPRGDRPESESAFAPGSASLPPPPSPREPGNPATSSSYDVRSARVGLGERRTMSSNLLCTSAASWRLSHSPSPGDPPTTPPPRTGSISTTSVLTRSRTVSTMRREVRETYPLPMSLRVCGYMRCVCVCEGEGGGEMGDGETTRPGGEERGAGARLSDSGRAACVLILFLRRGRVAAAGDGRAGWWGGCTHAY